MLEMQVCGCSSGLHTGGVLYGSGGYPRKAHSLASCSHVNLLQGATAYGSTSISPFNLPMPQQQLVAGVYCVLAHNSVASSP
jgi:hypothetical protein